MGTGLHDRLTALCLLLCFLFLSCPLPHDAEPGSSSNGRTPLVLDGPPVPALPPPGESSAAVPPPAAPRWVTGQTGPGGGTVIAHADTGLGYDFEVMPYTADTTLTWMQAYLLVPRFGGYNIWDLPNHTQLCWIYWLYRVKNRIRLEQFSPPGPGPGKYLWTQTEAGTNFALVLDLDESEASYSTEINTFYTANFFPVSKIPHGAPALYG